MRFHRVVVAPGRQRFVEPFAYTLGGARVIRLQAPRQILQQAFGGGCVRAPVQNESLLLTATCAS